MDQWIVKASYLKAIKIFLNKILSQKQLTIMPSSLVIWVLSKIIVEFWIISIHITIDYSYPCLHEVSISFSGK